MVARCCQRHLRYRRLRPRGLWISVHVVRCATVRVSVGEIVLFRKFYARSEVYVCVCLVRVVRVTTARMNINLYLFGHN